MFVFQISIQCTCTAFKCYVMQSRTTRKSAVIVTFQALFCALTDCGPVAGLMLYRLFKDTVTAQRSSEMKVRE
jgi:hypothetical protein